MKREAADDTLGHENSGPEGGRRPEQASNALNHMEVRIPRDAHQHVGAYSRRVGRVRQAR